MSELVRHGLCYDLFEDEWSIEPKEGGHYVTYSQASEIIAAKEREIDRLNKRSCDNGFCNTDHWYDRAKAAEAKLAQYEAQDPVGSVAELGIAGSRIKVAHNLNKDLEVGTPLYALPAPIK